jgi:cytochrome c biogenesis protein CcdA
MAPPVFAAPTTPSLDLYVFWGEGCPHCAAQQPFLKALAARHPGLVVHSHEIWRDPTHRPAFEMLARMHGIEAGAVPTVFVGGHAFIGDAPHIRRAIEAVVAHALAPPTEAPTVDADAQRNLLDLPVIGAVDLSAQPLLVMTLLVAFVDGINPCSLWVLTLLLGLVIRSGSRGRVALVGLTFLVTTSVVYGLFVVGLMGAMSVIVHLGWLRWLVAAVALAMGAVDIKDYFTFRRGPSRTIAAQHKPGLYGRFRMLMEPERAGPLLVATTVVVAGGAALVELPCTMGFPLVWNGVLLEHGVTGGVYLVLLALYLVVYLLDELLLFVVAVATLQMGRFTERHGRLLKLVGGSLMLALGLVMLIDPALMNEVAGSLLVFGAALAAALSIAAVHRWATGDGRAAHSG